MVEIDKLDIKILTLLQEDGRRSFQDVARLSLTSVPTVKSRVDRLTELGIIKKFTVDVNHSKLEGISSAVLIISASPKAVDNIIKRLLELEEVKELYTTPESDFAIVSRIIGDMKNILNIQNKLNLENIDKIRVIPVINELKKDTDVPFTSSSINIICSYCDKQVTEGVVRARIDETDYYFCCNTCKTAFMQKYERLKKNA